MFLVNFWFLLFIIFFLLFSEFDDYMYKLTPRSNKRNPWFTEFWEKHFSCSFSKDDFPTKKMCTGRLTLERKEINMSQFIPIIV